MRPCGPHSSCEARQVVRLVGEIVADGSAGIWCAPIVSPRAPRVRRHAIEIDRPRSKQLQAPGRTAWSRTCCTASPPATGEPAGEWFLDFDLPRGHRLYRARRIDVSSPDLERAAPTAVTSCGAMRFHELLFSGGLYLVLHLEFQSTVNRPRPPIMAVRMLAYTTGSVLYQKLIGEGPVGWTLPPCSVTAWSTRTRCASCAVQAAERIAGVAEQRAGGAAVCAEFAMRRVGPRGLSQGAQHAAQGGADCVAGVAALRGRADAAAFRRAGGGGHGGAGYGGGGRGVVAGAGRARRAAPGVEYLAALRASAGDDDLCGLPGSLSGGLGARGAGRGRVFGRGVAIAGARGVDRMER